MSTFILVIGILLFVGLVVLHELGHAIVAKRNGVEVEEFGIGFPPRALGKNLKNGTLLTINWLPLGGFVKLKGEHDSARGKGTYGAASLWVKTKILLAGVITNWLIAVVIFTFLALVGMPQILSNQFTVASDTVENYKAVEASTIVNDSPAQLAGLQSGDQLVSIGRQNVTGAEQFQQLTKSLAGQTVEVVYVRDGQQQQAEATLNSDSSGGKGYIGMSVGENTSRRSTWSAPIVGVGVTAQFTYETVKGLAGAIGNLFTAHFSEAGESVTGPIGIFSVLSSSAQDGFGSVLFLIGIISLTLAVMNALPIPALDGGRLFITIFFRLNKEVLTKEREELIQAAGMIALLCLMVIVTFLDVKRFF